MPRKNSDRDCWGYLLPITGELPPIELRLDEVMIGCGTACDVVVQADQLGCKKGALSKEHFRVGHSAFGAMLKNDSTRGTYVNGQPVDYGKQMLLPHDARIAITRPDLEVLVFADKATSDASTFIKEIKDKFVVAYQLGQGGYGQVFLVLDKKTHHQFAMKVIEQNTLAQREALIIKQLDHPCIIHMHNIIVSPHKMFLVMDYMRGGDLSLWVNNRKVLNEAQIKLIFYQLALAVKYLHQHGIGHRDLKPANILLEHKTPHTLIKVTDFGLAKDEHLHSTMKTRAGSEPYVAPEILTAKTYTKQVDIWSMGVILFYSLSGALPFNSIAEAKRMSHQVMWIPKQWMGSTAAAMSLVKSMLVKAPDRRITISEILNSQWLQDESMRAAADILMIQPEKPANRKLSAPAGQAAHSLLEPLPNRKLSVPTEGMRVAVPPRGILQYMGSAPTQYTPDQEGWWRRLLTRMGSVRRRSPKKNSAKPT